LGLFLADLGAEVIKIGAPHRRSGVSIGGQQAPRRPLIHNGDTHSPTPRFAWSIALCVCAIAWRRAGYLVGERVVVGEIAMTTSVSRPAAASAFLGARHRGLLALRLPGDVPLTDELLERLGQLNPEWRLERGHDGELVVRMGSGGPSFMITAEILAVVFAWSKAVRGYAFGADASFNVVDPLGGEPMRNPDISWVSPEQMEAMGGFPPMRGFWPVCPAFVVEVRSPGDSLRNQHGRMADWLRFGAQLGWLVDPQRRDVWIYRPDQEPQQLRRPAVVGGEPLLNGMRMDFEPIWQLIDDAEAAAAATE